jgi:hypothetical protein
MEICIVFRGTQQCSGHANFLVDTTKRVLDLFKNLYGCYRSELTRNVHTLYEPVSWLKLNKRWKAGIQGEVKKLAIRRMFYLPVNYPTGSLCLFISALFAPEARGILGWIFCWWVCKLHAATYCKIRSGGTEWKIQSWLRRYSRGFQQYDSHRQ